MTRAPAPSSTRTSLLVVYAGYCARYLSLLILIPFYGRVLGPADYGRVLTAMSLYTVVWAIVNFGFSPVGTRNIAGLHDPRRLADELGRHLHGRLLLALAGVAVGVGATLMSPVLRADPKFGALATACGLMAAFNLGWFFQGTQRYAVSILLEVLGFFVHVVLVLLMVHKPSDSDSVMVALFCAQTLVNVVAYTLARRQLEGQAIRPRHGLSLVKESTSLFLLGGVSQLTLNASSYLLSLFATAQEVGYFGSAERLATAVLGLLTPADQVMVSAVAARMNSGRGEHDTLALMRKGVGGLLIFGIVTMTCTLLLAPLLVPIILGPSFGPSAHLLQLLAPMLPFAAFSQAVGMYVLVPLRRERMAVWVTLACAAVHIAGVLLLASPLGGTGAAIARVISGVMSAVLLGVVLHRLGLLRGLMRGRLQGGATLAGDGISAREPMTDAETPVPLDGASAAPRAAAARPLRPGGLVLPRLVAPRVSIVICNYNYARFLDQAVRSAHEQTLACEVIVVDDGSTDGSREILRGWQDRVRVVYQANGGQVAAYTTGFEHSTGDVVIFLDSDDYLEPGAAQVVSCLFDEDVAKVHYGMRLVDDADRAFGGSIPAVLAEGDVLPLFLRRGLLYPSAPGSGNAYRRSVLERLFPLPSVPEDRHGADFYTIYGAIAFGRIAAYRAPLAAYRLHGSMQEATSGLVFGNVARHSNERAKLAERMARFRPWIHDRSGGAVVLPQQLLDFSNQRTWFATAVLRHGYFGGLRSGRLELGPMLSALWMQREYSVARRIALSAWAFAVLLLPRVLARPLARYVCNPASRHSGGLWRHPRDVASGDAMSSWMSMEAGATLPMPLTEDSPPAASRPPAPPATRVTSKEQP